MKTNPKERDKITIDLQETLHDIVDLPHRPEERPYLRFSDLDEVRRDILEFKKQLREEVDRHGGISELARKTGIRAQMGAIRSPDFLGRINRER